MSYELGVMSYELVSEVVQILPNERHCYRFTGTNALGVHLDLHGKLTAVMIHRPESR